MPSFIYFLKFIYLTVFMAQTVKHLSTMWEAWVRSLGQEDPLEKGMATHSSILAWRIPWTEEPGGLQSVKVKSLSRVRLVVTPWTPDSSVHGIF